MATTTRLRRSHRTAKRRALGTAMLVRVRALEVPPIKDGLVIGKDAATGGEAMLRALRLMTNEKFDRIQVQDCMIEEIIVRAAVLRTLGRDRLLVFVLKRVKPVMAETELPMLGIEVEELIERGSEISVTARA